MHFFNVKFDSKNYFLNIDSHSNVKFDTKIPYFLGANRSGGGRRFGNQFGSRDYRQSGGGGRGGGGGGMRGGGQGSRSSG
jgi:hypothetical protein